MTESYINDTGFPGWVLAPGTPVEPVEDDYEFAPQEAVEKWLDMKYGLRIHWGPLAHIAEGDWCVNGTDITTDRSERWPSRMEFEHFLYSYLHREFNPVAFDADDWADMMVRQGFKYFVFTTKTHVGFSLWDTKTRVKRRFVYSGPRAGQIEECDEAYSIMETFGRDIVREVVDAGRRRDLGIGLYFSHPDFYDADFRVESYNHPRPDPEYSRESDPEGWARMVCRHREQILELLTAYGHIDLMGFDLAMSADFWSDMKANVKAARKAAPDTLFRRRGLGDYGDYQTPENNMPITGGGGPVPITKPWQLIHTLGESFFYEPAVENYHSQEWILETLIDAVAKGGNFMICIGPDAWGQFHPEAVRRLDYVGRWLEVNGEAIYGTRPWRTMQEGDCFFTRTKDSRHLFAISTKWPGASLRLERVHARAGSSIRLLGDGEDLVFAQDDAGLTIDLPECLQHPEARPCEQAYAFRIELE